ncbi:hypothetical protein SLS53_001306 [Cytospora paraplurivora]|uniref:RING-CH-type domain-containing protein n=1 Tax=Cytospora paraplurivora TaxID=2898453 RepID=A0AAN9YMK4_9PEZI
MSEPSNPARTASPELNSHFEEGETAAHAAEEAPPRTWRHYRPRTCRICLEDVFPTFEGPGISTKYLGREPRVRYTSEDPELGRLMRPCKCKGSQQYVHEGCLRAWRRASPADRNLWQCPTCRYEYKLERLTWARWVSSKILRAFLTAVVFIVAVFALGFVADPIVNLCSGPMTAVLDAVTEGLDEFEEIRDWIPDEDTETWVDHFSKGILSLGVVGLVKAFVSMNPWDWYNIRIGGGIRRGGRGRNRLENISWMLVFIGVLTFLTAVWKGVSAVCARYQERVSDRIVDVQGDDEDEADEEPQAESRKDQ